MRKFLASQGEILDPGCTVDGKGCAVALLDTRRDYRLVSFERQACHEAEPSGFACSFRATVSCVYSVQGKPSPLVADLYCGPLFNKQSSYTAVFEYVGRTWMLVRFTQG